MPIVCHQREAMSRYLARRRGQTFRDFGIAAHEFGAAIAAELEATYRGQLPTANLLLRPRTAAEFCERIRDKRGWFVPDDVILRELLKRPVENPAIDDQSALGDPSLEGVPLSATDFLATIAAEFEQEYQGVWKFEDFQLYPCEAARFCAVIRQRFAWFVLADSTIMGALRLRAGLQPGGRRAPTAAA